MTLEEALAEVKRTPTFDGCKWTAHDVAIARDEGHEAIAVILNTVASGDLIPRTDAELAVALVVQRAAEEQERRAEYWTRQLEAPGIKKSSVGATQGRIAGHFSAAESFRSLAPANTLAEVQALKAERGEYVASLIRCNDEAVQKIAAERTRAEAAEAEVARLREALNATSARNRTLARKMRGRGKRAAEEAKG